MRRSGASDLTKFDEKRLGERKRNSYEEVEISSLVAASRDRFFFRDRRFFFLSMRLDQIDQE